MRIIQINKYNYLRGGSEKYFLTISSALRAAGHQVAIFSMTHPKNIPSEYDRYFVSRVSFSRAGFSAKIKAAGRIFWSFSAARKLSALINDFKPDLIHIHNIYHQISPSILRSAQKKGIPVVAHLHDYKLICPNYQLYTHEKICERCRGGRYYNCTSYKCLKNSRLKSFLASLEMYFHHRILKIYERNVDLLIAPSQFIKDKFIEFGWPEAKIKLLYNFSESSDLAAPLAPVKNYLLYYGRLSREKGIDYLIRSLSKTEYKLKITGAGDERENLEKLCQDLKLENKVEFTGPQYGQDLKIIIDQARAVIIPSRWPENMPFGLIESLAQGKALIAARVGGLSELISDGNNALLFDSNSQVDLKLALKRLEKMDLTRLGLAAKASVAPLELKIHLEKLLLLYQTLLPNNKAG